MKDEELGIRLRVKGLEETRRQVGGLQRLFNNLKGRALGALGFTHDARTGERAFTPFGERKSGGGSTAGGVLGGMVAFNVLQKIGDAARQTARAAFDPSLTMLEKQVRIGQAGLGLIPGVGGALSEIAGALAQPQINVARGTQQSLSQIFGPAFEAFGQQNPNATVSELVGMMRDRFGPMIDRVKPTLRGGARGREAGAQLLGSDPEDRLDLGELLEQAKSELRKTGNAFGIDSGWIEEKLNSYQEAFNNLKDNTSSMSRALDQIVDFWREALQGKRGVFPGLSR